MWCLDDAHHGICLLGDESHGICLSHAECQVIFLPDDECQGMLPPDDARHGICLLAAARMFTGISYGLCLSVYMPLPTRGNWVYAYSTKMGTAVAFWVTRVKANGVLTIHVCAYFSRTKSLMASCSCDEAFPGKCLLDDLPAQPSVLKPGYMP